MCVFEANIQCRLRRRWKRERQQGYILPSVATEPIFILSFRVSPFVLAQPTLWYVLWLPPLSIVAVQSFSLTHRTIGRPSCPLPHHNLPVYLMMRTFSRQYFSLFFVLHNHCPHYFLTSLFSFLVICKNSAQFLRLNVFMFLRKALTSFDKYNPMGE